MSCEIKKLKPANPDRVDIHNDRELQEYWVDYFEASRESILEAVKRVGCRADAVYKHLGKNQS
jgi:hypothetical protein